MKKSIKGLFSKLQENGHGALIDGFVILKNIRGGILQTDNSQGTCNNTYTCSGTNSTTCANSGKCGDSHNTGTCTNSGTCLF